MYELVIFLSIVLWSAIALYYVRHRACGLYHPVSVYLAFHALVFLVRPIFSVTFDFSLIYDAVGFYPSLWDRVTVLLAANLALLTFVFVCLGVGGQAMVWRQDEQGRFDRRKWIRYFWIVAIPLGLASLYTTLWQWQFEASSGDINQMDMRTGVRTMNATSGYFLILGSTMATLTVMCAYLYRFSLLSLVPFAAFAILRLGTGGRTDFIAATIMLVMLFLYDRRRKWPDTRTFVLGAVAVLAFNSVVADRGAAIRSAFGLSGINENRVWEDKVYKPFEQNDTAMLEAFEFVVYAVPQRTGSYDYFANNLRIFVEPIPRAWWADKPAGSPVQFFYLYDYGRPVGMALSMPAVGWLSLGYFGVAIWSALFALFYGKAYAWFVRGRQSTLQTLIYAIVFSTALFAFRDGLLLTIIKFSFVYFIPVVALVALVRVLRPQLLQPSTEAAARGTAEGLVIPARSRREAGAMPRAARAIARTGLVPRAWRS